MLSHSHHLFPHHHGLVLQVLPKVKVAQRQHGTSRLGVDLPCVLVRVMLPDHLRCLESWDQNRIVVIAEIQRYLPVKLGDQVFLSFDEQVLRAEQLLAIVVAKRIVGETTDDDDEKI